MQDRNRYKTCGKNRRFERLSVLAVMMVFMTAFLCACGYTEEEKAHMREIAALGEENAVEYIRNKYGITASAEEVEVCKDRESGLAGAVSFPPANGDVLATMRYGDETFRVRISGERHTLAGTDDFQYALVAADAEQYFETLLGYEIYDIYLSYKENRIDGDPYTDDQEENLISEYYKTGDFEKFLQRHPVNLRIDDCTDQDLTALAAVNPAASAFFETYAKDYAVKAVLISYRSAADYRNGYRHTYGRGGLLDFEIGSDGLYIRSYAAFEKEDAAIGRFELLEYDGMVFSCVDKAPGNDLQVCAGQQAWKELGETKGEPLSVVCSVRREGCGDVVVYIPKERLLEYKGGASVFIQHFYEDKWYQYETSLYETTDQKYKFFTFPGVGGSDFDFAVF